MSEESAAAADCTMHHWMIDEPNGPTSNGTCRICGAKREFKNSIQGSGWDRDGRRRRAARQRSASS